MDARLRPVPPGGPGCRGRRGALRLGSRVHLSASAGPSLGAPRPLSGRVPLLASSFPARRAPRPRRPKSERGRIVVPGSPLPVPPPRGGGPSGARGGPDRLQGFPSPGSATVRWTHRILTGLPGSGVPRGSRALPAASGWTGTFAAPGLPAIGKPEPSLRLFAAGGVRCSPGLPRARPDTARLTPYGVDPSLGVGPPPRVLADARPRVGTSCPDDRVQGCPRPARRSCR
jgi:hypothetical protein